MKSVGQQGVQEGGKKGGLDVVYRLPHRVRDVVWTRGERCLRIYRGLWIFPQR